LRFRLGWRLGGRLGGKAGGARSCPGGRDELHL
jgi:hypothetical protein